MASWFAIASAPMMNQMPIWVRPAAPTPMILPDIIAFGLVAATSSSTTRLDFSVTTDRITLMPYRVIAM